MFFTFIWIIFMVYSVSGLFSLFPIFINVPWRWPLPSCAGSHQFTWFGNCQSCSPQSNWTAMPDFFCFLPPTSTTATSAGTNNHRRMSMYTCIPPQTMAPQPTTTMRATQHTARTTVALPHHQSNAPLERATFDGWRAVGCGEKTRNGLGLSPSENQHEVDQAELRDMVAVVACQGK